MSARDIFGRPLLVLRLEYLDGRIDALKDYFASVTEGLRARLAVLNSQQAQSDTPVLQYILLIDMKNATTRNFVSSLVWCS